MKIDTPVVDTHLHVWDPGRLRYPWLETVPKLNKPHLLEHYRQATRGLPIERMVFVQCEADFAQFLDEVEWVAGQARTDPRIQGIVAWAPLEKGAAAREDLDALARQPLVRGIRRIIQFEDHVDFCLRPDFIRGVQLLAERDWSFDLCIKGDAQFVNTLELVRRCPDVRFMLDHIAKPDIAQGVLDPWRSHIRTLAALPNTWCKVSGLVTEADHENWRKEDLVPYLDTVIEAFGFDRCCFGGDWPVCTLAASYPRWFDTLMAYLEPHTEADRRNLLHDTALEFYRLPS